MRKLYMVLATLLCFAASGFAQSGIFESYAILDINGGGNSFYDMQATTGNPDLQGANLGSFTPANSIIVKGGQNKTFKCAPCDIINSNFYYRVWLTSAGPSGSFININEAFLANLGTGCGGNDQSWEGTSGAANILTGLPAGSYTLEVYSAADYQGCGTGTNFSNNGGANYRATFTLCGSGSGALPAGNYAIPGCFATITAAVTYINTNGISGSGGVVFDVAAGYTETITARINLTATGTATNPIIFQKSGIGANPVITAHAGTTTPGSAIPDGIWSLQGSDYVTIDGINLNDPNTTNPATMEYGYGLFKNSASDGANNNTIRNCTVNVQRVNNASGTAPMVEGSVGILVINAIPTAATTVITPTNGGTLANNGTNSNNKFYSNTINGGNYGIALSGFAATTGAGPSPVATTFLGDIGNDIGGAAAATGNTILNFGGGGTTNSSAGIRANNQWSVNISYNTVNNNNGSGVNHGTTLRGIYAQAGTSAAATINNNTVSIQSGATTSACFAIDNGIGSTAAANTININNNIISVGYPTATSGVYTAINNGSTATTVNINGNSISQISGVAFGGTGTHVMIESGSPVTANTNNNIVSNIARNGASGSWRIIKSTTPTTAWNCNNNVIDGMSWSLAASTGSIDGIYDLSSATVVNIAGNTVRNMSTPTTGTINGVNINTVSGTHTCQNNQVYNFSTTSGGAGGATFTGIVFSVGNTSISGNTIYSLNSTGTTGGTGGTITGIRQGGGTSNSAFKNKIYDLSSTSTGATIIGINLSGGTTNTVYNNLVGDLRAPAANGANIIRGIDIASTNALVYYNTVYINATSSGAAFGTTALNTSTATTLTLRNNIFVNTSTANTTGLTVAYRRSSTTLTSYAAASNNNLFYAGTPGASNLIFYDGTNSDQLIAAYKTRVTPRDANSVTENPPFLSTTGANATFLHIDPAIATQVESGAATISGFTDDYDGDTRNVSTPDIGADEGTFTLADFSPPIITYTPLSFTCNGAVNRTLTATITDASGVPQSGIGLPVLYWRINAGAYTAATGTWVSGNTYTFSFGAGAVASDVVSYYIVAQDNAGTPNVGAFPAAGAGGFTTNPPAAATPPTTPSSYTINNSLGGTYTVGAGGSYTTLTAAINAYNNSCLTAPVIFSLTDASYTTPAETFPLQINVNPDASSVNTLTIMPAAGIAATVSASASTILKLNGADYITIDGVNSGGSSLTFSNTNTVSGTTVIWVASLGAGAGATNNIIRNCTIQNGTVGSSTVANFGIFAGNTSGAANGEDNDNLTIQNNTIRTTTIGIQAVGGTVAGQANDNTIIENNTVGNAVVASSIGRYGVFIGQSSNALITRNNIFNVVTSTAGISATNNCIGIAITTGTINSSVTKNKISDIRYTGASGYGGKGIDINTGSTTSNLTIANNFVSNIMGDGWSDASTDGIAGIRVLGTTGGVNIYYNSVNLGSGTFAGNTSGTQSGALVIGSTVTNLNIVNNIFSTNLQNSNASGAKSFAILSKTTTNSVFTSINYNDYAPSGTQGIIGQLNAVDATTLAAWQTASGQDAASKNVAPLYTSATDLHLLVASNPLLNAAATPIGSITDDIDADARDASTPDIGADEFAPVTCTTAIGGTASGSTSACASYAGTITATGYSTGTGSTYQWVSATNPAGPWTAIGGANNPASYTISPAITVTTYYKLAVTCATNSSLDSSTIATITINPIPTVPVTPAGPVTICAPNTQTLDASGTNAASPIFQWLNNNVAIGGAASATYAAGATGSYRVRVQDGVTGCFDTSVAVVVTVNPAPTTPVITPSSPTICAGTVQRLVASSSIAAMATSGTGASTTVGNTTASTLGPNPLQIFYGGDKQQMLYTASELSTLGLSAGSSISAIALNLVTADNTIGLQNLVVKMKNTATATLTTWESGLTTVRTPATYTTAVGVNTITLTTPFTWNGTDNLAIEINYSNNNGGTTGSIFNTARYSPTAFQSTLFYRVDNASAATVDAFTGTPTNSYSSRNDVTFTYAAPVANITWTPASGLYLDSAGSLPYTAGGNEDTLYAMPSGTQTYTVTATSGAGCPSTANVTVTVTPPTSPNGLAGMPTPGATIEWAETHNVNNGQNYVEAASCDLINKVVPFGGSPVSGNIRSAVRVDSGANKMGTGILLGARFYAIEPAVNPATSTATITLYYLQSEFDNYNLKALDSAHYALPTGPGDAVGISNLLIRQYHGTPTGGYLPTNYSGANEDIDPADGNIVWNATASRWEVTFSVSSFSGFFLTSKVFVVPVRLLNIRGEVTGNTNTISWTTSQEQNNRKFIIERSTDGRSFAAIGETASRAFNGTSSTPLSYSFVDALPVNGKSFYRLQMVSMNGSNEQSPVVTLLRGKGSFEIVDVRPNPATSMVYFNVIGSNSALTVVVRSLNGKEVVRTSLSQSNAFSINIGGLANGMYILEATDRNGEKATYKIVKQ